MYGLGLVVASSSMCMYYCLDLASDFGVHSCHRTEEFKQVTEESKVKSKRTSTQRPCLLRSEKRTLLAISS